MQNQRTFLINIIVRRFGSADTFSHVWLKFATVLSQLVPCVCSQQCSWCMLVYSTILWIQKQFIPALYYLSVDAKWLFNLSLTSTTLESGTWFSELIKGKPSNILDRKVIAVVCYQLARGWMLDSSIWHSFINCCKSAYSTWLEPCVIRITASAWHKTKQ